MGRQSQVLLAHQKTLIYVINRLHEAYGRDVLVKLNLEHLDETTWGRWRKGANLCPESVAKRLVLHAERHGLIEDKMQAEVATLMGSIDHRLGLEEVIAEFKERSIRQLQAIEVTRDAFQRRVFLNRRSVSTFRADLNRLEMRIQESLTELGNKNPEVLRKIYTSALEYLYFKETEKEAFQIMNDITEEQAAQEKDREFPNLKRGKPRKSAEVIPIGSTRRRSN